MTLRGCCAVLLAVALGASGCTATVLQTAGPAVEAKIVSSEADSLDLLGSDGRVYRMPRGDIRAIDHPGNVLMVIGAVAGGLGVVLGAAIAASAKNADDRVMGYGMGAMYLAHGLALGILGGVPYFRSKRAARNFEDASPAW